MNTNQKSDTKERLKATVAAIRQRGEPIEVYWGNGDADEPHDAEGEFANEWDGSFADLKTLRQWIEKYGEDGRTLTIYCRGDFREVKLRADTRALENS